MPILFKGGIMPDSHKDKTSASPITRLEAPEQLIVPMSQHVGAECVPLVNVGDRVLVGQKIGDTEDETGCPVHSPVSGFVTSVSPEWHSSGLRKLSVVIKNDFEERWADTCVPQENIAALQPERIMSLAREGGIVGMGGAGYPLHLKLKAAYEKGTELVIVNGVECEPFVTADHRAMVEYPNEIVEGIKLVMQCLSPKDVILAVGDDKPDALATMRLMCEGTHIKVVSLPARYPQGGEKQLIQSLTGREVPEGTHPLDIGCIVLNVDTCASLSRWIRGGRPLTKRVVTVSGPAVVNSRNLLVRIGTPYKYVFEHCGGFSGEPTKIVDGGPMRGMAQHSLEVPVTKGTASLLAFADKEREERLTCIRCGKCIRVCPMHLMPTSLYNWAKSAQYETCGKNHISECIECGCCAYVCPGKLDLVQAIRTAKAALKK